MRGVVFCVGVLGLFLVLLSDPLAAQVPTGTIAGTVTDQSSAIIAKASVTVRNRDTGATRAAETAGDGTFSVPSLLAGPYDVVIEAPGFQPTVTPVDVTTGSTTSVKVSLQVSTRQEAITVVGTSALIDLESNKVQGVVNRTQIENLPLNGRSFLNLAQLQPGVTVNLGNPAQFNAQFNVSVLGAESSHTAITVDGGNVRNPIEGGTSQNFSQEVVQEFQISTANFDLSTGITAFGAINVVTRSGTNDFHGAGYYYLRNNEMAAYPGLVRSPLTDNPDFSRKQGGVAIGGPIVKDKLLFFANYERTDQNGVYIVQPDLPSVQGFGTLAPAPYVSNQASGRIDVHPGGKHSYFGRWSYDGNTNSGPFGTPVAPSNFVSNDNRVDQQLFGWTSVLTSSVVNDFRFSHMYWKNRNTPADCVGDPNTLCMGEGGPEIFYLNSVNFQLGNNFNSPQGRDLHRFPISDNLTWSKGEHQMKFGGDFEHVHAPGYWGFFDPARVYLLSPEYLANINPALPALFGLPDKTIHNYNDLKKLPVVTFIMGIGDPSQPSYHPDQAVANNRYHLYAQDSWKVKSNFTLNYGLGWQFEDNVLNYDLQRPSLIAPLYGNDLTPPNKQYKNFSPAAGFAYTLNTKRATVIRGGAGIFYDTQLGWWRLGERAVLGGSGRQFIGNAAVTNPLTGLPFSTAYLNSLALNYGTFLNLLPQLQAQQNAKYPGTGDQPQILLSKQATSLGALYPKDFPTAHADHYNIGVQRELSSAMAVQADFVYRKGFNQTPGGFFGASVDFNRFNAIGGPVIPVCTAAQVNNPAANCSSGPFNFWWAGAKSEYKALLLRLDKRMSNHYQFTVSYALQDQQAIQDITQNLNDYFATYGPTLPRHNLTASVTFDIKGGFQVSLLSYFLSRAPVAPLINGFDNNGTNTTSGAYTPLLAVTSGGYSGFLSKDDLQALVNQYNSTVAGTPTPEAKAGLNPTQKFPKITLPADYQLGDTFSSQDLRVMKSFRLGARATELRLIGEVFNIFNVSNLTNFNFNLASPATFGKANQRVGQTFGTGGPRAAQIAVRLGF